MCCQHRCRTAYNTNWHGTSTGMLQHKRARRRLNQTACSRHLSRRCPVYLLANSDESRQIPCQPQSMTLQLCPRHGAAFRVCQGFWREAQTSRKSRVQRLGAYGRPCEQSAGHGYNQCPSPVAFSHMECSRGISNRTNQHRTSDGALARYQFMRLPIPSLTLCNFSWTLELRQVGLCQLPAAIAPSRCSFNGCMLVL
jgi:hypothetical protein